MFVRSTAQIVQELFTASVTKPWNTGDNCGSSFVTTNGLNTFEKTPEKLNNFNLPYERLFASGSVFYHKERVRERVKEREREEYAEQKKPVEERNS